MRIFLLFFHRLISLSLLTASLFLALLVLPIYTTQSQQPLVIQNTILHTSSKPLTNLVNNFNNPYPQETIIVNLHPNQAATTISLFNGTMEKGLAQIITLSPTLSPLPTKTVAKPIVEATKQADDKLIDYWVALNQHEDFTDGSFPKDPNCQVSDNSHDSYERHWAADDYKPYNATNDLWAAWPARGGADGIDPYLNPLYPDNLLSLITCGPYTMTTALRLLTRFDMWADMDDPNDWFFMGVSIDGGITYQGLGPFSESSPWQTKSVYFEGLTGEEEVWVAWIFSSDDAGPLREGVWLDNLEIWRYEPPLDKCGNLDPGFKGVNIPTYETVGGLGDFPVIRGGETRMVDGLIAARAEWVRLVFMHQHGSIDLQAMGRIIDTLCGYGMSTIGIINDQSLDRDDINDPNTFDDYQLAFTQTSELLAYYFTDRINVWEVWNEPNFDSDPDPVLTGPPYLEPELYAELLINTHDTISKTNPNTIVIFGGLAGAWKPAFDYFELVLIELNKSNRLDVFNKLGIHPYFDDTHSLDPDIYLRENNTTLLAKFLNSMFSLGLGNIKIWATEIGWNSAAGQAGMACWKDFVVTEAEQATYLTKSFDILFNEVPMPLNPDEQAVEKIIWYQYRDVGLPKDLMCPPTTPKNTLSPASSLARYAPVVDTTIQSSSVISWWFGLVDGAEVAKPSRCAFAAYPQNCTNIYLPMVLK